MTWVCGCSCLFVCLFSELFCHFLGFHLHQEPTPFCCQGKIQNSDICLIQRRVSHSNRTQNTADFLRIPGVLTKCFFPQLPVPVLHGNAQHDLSSRHSKRRPLLHQRCTWRLFMAPRWGKKCNFSVKLHRTQLLRSQFIPILWPIC